ncbi:YgiQ family radical SAM protein [bacterium]|nr:YgiQ family radical SAM protein [bacterium]
MFLPMSRAELDDLGWPGLDIILVSGDAYIDSPFIGVSLIGKVLLEAGYRVGMIAQPDISSGRDITRLGEPRLFWGVSSGCVDSLVANYTPTLKKRQRDDLTAGGLNVRRPDRAVIVYTNLIKHYFKNTVPIVLGGIEASLRRISHYDYWSDSIRRSVLFDAKADALVYGQGEATVVELADRLARGEDWRDLNGLCYAAEEPVKDYLALPDHEQVRTDTAAFISMFHLFYQNTDPLTARGLYQKQDGRYLIQNPPRSSMTSQELDRVHSLDYERAAHPLELEHGPLRALETIRFAIPTHRGCYGECNFCAISVHQGRTVVSRTIDSIVQEARYLTSLPGFKGTISDLSGPTANTYGFECSRKLEHGACRHRRCLFPEICPELQVDHGNLTRLLQALRKVPGIKHVFVGSGLRYDLLLADVRNGDRFLRQLTRYHISGQLKVAPEHSQTKVTELMGKPGLEKLKDFRQKFERAVRQAGRRSFLTYYLMAAHPGCTEHDMNELARFCRRELKIKPEQVQIFTPTPSTYSSLMYWTGQDPFSGQRLFIERNKRNKEQQKRLITG